MPKKNLNKKYIDRNIFLLNSYLNDKNAKYEIFYKCLKGIFLNLFSKYGFFYTWAPNLSLTHIFFFKCILYIYF